MSMKKTELKEIYIKIKSIADLENRGIITREVAIVEVTKLYDKIKTLVVKSNQRLLEE